MGSSHNQVLYYPLIDCNVQIEQSEFQSRKLYNGKYGVQLTTNDITIFQHIQPLLSQQITLEQMPNTLLFTAEYDPLCDEGEQYANLLKDSGATVKHVHFDGNIHGFMQYFPGSPDHIRGYQLTSEFLN